MLSLFGFGFLLGMQHALQADHLAAVASLTSHEKSPKSAMLYGATWGMGHTLTLSLFSGIILIFGFQLSDQITRWLEFAVGGMLVWLGISVLISLWRERIHIHVHGHADGTLHVHAHRHANAMMEHHQSQHQHCHKPFLSRSFIQTLLIGVMHGMAGTAALLVFVAATAITSISQAIGYILMFGFGSVLGMALLSAAIVIPASYSLRNSPKLNGAFRLIVGAGTSSLGAYILAVNWSY